MQVRRLAVVPTRKRRPLQGHKLLLRELAITAEIRELQQERKEVRQQIRATLEHGDQFAPGLHGARIEVRKVLIVR